MLSRFSRVRLFAAQWTVACQAPLSMRFSRWEYWNGSPFSAAGYLPNPGIKSLFPASSGLQADSLPLSHKGSPANSGFNQMLLQKNQIDLISVFVIQRNKNSGWSGKRSRKFSRNEYNLEPWSECCWKKFAVSLLYYYMMFWVYQQRKVITTQPEPFLRVVLAACNLDGWGNVFSETEWACLLLGNSNTK